jgi:hypothetical protein
MNELDREHRERMAMCQTIQPCPKTHPHGPGCYSAATVLEAVHRFIAVPKAPIRRAAPASSPQPQRRTRDLGADLTAAVFGDARRRR